ncbi:hypothetical protein BU17DRAFT_68340 [Hysterangium stoloniferum]|nr:hypothetical protein BU17DRAFT_68340 [Hysterangium stoloniferum]
MALVVISLSATVDRLHEDLQTPFGTAIIQHRHPRSCTGNVSINREESANVWAKAADGGAAAEGPTAASRAAEFAAAALRRDLRGGGQNIRLDGSNMLRKGTSFNCREKATSGECEQFPWATQGEEQGTMTGCLIERSVMEKRGWSDSAIGRVPGEANEMDKVNTRSTKSSALMPGRLFGPVGTVDSNLVVNACGLSGTHKSDPGSNTRYQDRKKENDPFLCLVFVILLDFLLVIPNLIIRKMYRTLSILMRKFVLNVWETEALVETRHSGTERQKKIVINLGILILVDGTWAAVVQALYHGYNSTPHKSVQQKHVASACAMIPMEDSRWNLMIEHRTWQRKHEVMAIRYQMEVVWQSNRRGLSDIHVPRTRTPVTQLQNFQGPLKSTQSKFGAAVPTPSEPSPQSPKKAASTKRHGPSSPKRARLRPAEAKRAVYAPDYDADDEKILSARIEPRQAIPDPDANVFLNNGMDVDTEFTPRSIQK